LVFRRLRRTGQHEALDAELCQLRFGRRVLEHEVGGRGHQLRWLRERLVGLLGLGVLELEGVLVRLNSGRGAP